MTVSYSAVIFKIFANTDKFIGSILSNFLSPILENTLREGMVKGILQNMLMDISSGFFSLQFSGHFDCVTSNADVVRAIQN